MSHAAPGRHRAPERHSATLALASSLGRTTRPAAKASAVVAVSAGLVAAFSGPASAGPERATDRALTHAVSADITGAEVSGTAISGAAAAVSVAPAVALSAAAPVSSGLVSPTFGDIGFTGVVKPKPKPLAKPTPPVVVTVKQPVQHTVKHVVHVVHVVQHVVVRPAPVRHVAPHAARPVQHASRSTVRRAIQHISAPVHHASAPTHHASAPPHHSSPPASSGSAHSGILAIAARYAGVPYVYGGSSPSGFDCSGFTSYVFRQAGISLPRTASSQQASVHHVSSPAPGDLVFFGSPAYHVGIYAGGGKMWDAPHTGSTVGLHTIYGGVSGYGRP